MTKTFVAPKAELIIVITPGINLVIPGVFFSNIGVYNFSQTKDIVRYMPGTLFIISASTVSQRLSTYKLTQKL